MSFSLWDAQSLHHRVFIEHSLSFYLSLSFSLSLWDAQSSSTILIVFPKFHSKPNCVRVFQLIIVIISIISLSLSVVGTAAELRRRSCQDLRLSLPRSAPLTGGDGARRSVRHGGGHDVICHSRRGWREKTDDV